MLQRREEVGFSAEAHSTVHGIERFLDRDHPIEREIARAYDPAGAAPRELVEDLVATRRQRREIGRHGRAAHVAAIARQRVHPRHGAIISISDGDRIHTGLHRPFVRDPVGEPRAQLVVDRGEPTR
jgi:hypothetical protein